MGVAKVISLIVRPLQAAHLCFEVDGIVESGTVLGAPAPFFDFPATYGILGSMPPVPGHPARLLYDFLEIQNLVHPFALVSLRAEPRKAALSKAINARANAFYAKYANAPAIIAQMNSYFSPSIVGSKPQRLAVLQSISEDQWNQLKAAYNSEQPPLIGVVKTTSSVLQSITTSQGSSSEAGQSSEESVEAPVQGTVQLTNPPQSGAPLVGAGFTAGGLTEVDYEQGTSGANTTSRGSAGEIQTIVNTDYGYRVPYDEGAAQYERAQISLIDQQFASFMYAQNLPFLDAVFLNELNSIDSDVYRLQIAFLNTFLMSPIPGIVTGVYKNPGDAVKAGEPVIRVENPAIVLLVATLIYSEPIPIGSLVTIGTTLFGSTPLAPPLAGPVVAVRGQHQEDQWEVIVQCGNLDSSGNPIFPLGYQFDYDDTTVSIT